MGYHVNALKELGEIKGSEFFTPAKYDVPKCLLPIPTNWRVILGSYEIEKNCSAMTVGFSWRLLRPCFGGVQNVG